jgi:hypothetical protein
MSPRHGHSAREVVGRSEDKYAKLQLAKSQAHIRRLQHVLEHRLISTCIESVPSQAPTSYNLYDR